MVGVEKAKIKKIQIALLEWFEKNGREFPWRETNNPYEILIAEKLLQQTSVRDDLVQAYYKLLSKYPNVQALAKANHKDIQKIIKPLGLHYRAKEMVRLAKEICKKYKGKIPDNLTDLLSLFGIGDYSARAILCFAFRQIVPVVDTNVARIMYRVFGIQGKTPTNPSRKKDLILLGTKLLPQSKPQEMNWSMIDLGSRVCTTSNPHCDICPLNRVCQFNMQNSSVRGEEKFYAPS